MDKPRVFLSKDQAKQVLADEPEAILAVNAPIIVHYDTNQQAAHKLIDQSVAIELTGERARALGYGIMVYNPDQTAQGLKTNEEKLSIVESALIAANQEHASAPEWWHEGKQQPVNTK